MKAHCFQKLLVPVVGLLLWAGVICIPGFEPPQASPFLQNSPSTEEQSAQSGGEDNRLPTDFLLKEARNAAENHDFVIAEALYQTVLLRERQNLPAILELAAVYEQTGKLEYARGLLLRASVLRPHDEKIIAMNKEISELLSTVLIEEVDSLIARKQCDLALPKLSMLLTIEPENPDFYYKKAICYSEIGKPETALIHVDDALRLQKNEEYFRLRADITERIEQDKVEKLVANAQALLTNDSPANRERALQLIGEILQLNPEHEWAKRSFVVLSSGESLSGEWIAAAGSEAGTDRNAGTDPDGGPGTGVISRVSGNLQTLVFPAVFIAACFLAILAVRIFRRKPPVHPLSGRFSHFSLREILKCVEANARTGVLHVHSKFTGGEIYFKNGTVCYCKAGSLTGSDAFSLLVAKMRAGTFQFLDCAPPQEEAVDISPIQQPAREKQGTPSNHSGGPAPVKSRRPKSRMRELLDSK